MIHDPKGLSVLVKAMNDNPLGAILVIVLSLVGAGFLLLLKM